MVELVHARRTPEERAREFEPTGQAIRNWVRQADRAVDRHRTSYGVTLPPLHRTNSGSRTSPTFRPGRRPVPGRGLDAFTRRVVGWAMATHLRSERVLDALAMTLMQRRPKDVIHHADQGCHDVDRFRAALQGSRRVSLDGPLGDRYDNAMCESFFATLECALLDRTRFRTQTDARIGVFEFIEAWYKPHRRPSALDYRSPIQYERSHQLTVEPRKP